jgi:hypothetical protein
MTDQFTEAQIEAAILAATETARKHETFAARWPDDYDEAERKVVVEMYRAALLAAAPKAPIAEGWQPIETAPKDREIIVAPSIWLNRGWDTAQWDGDQYAKKPRPFWRRPSPASVIECRAITPEFWCEPSVPPLANGEKK